MSRRVSRAARLLDERVGLQMVEATGTRHAYLDAPRTVSKVGAHPSDTDRPVDRHRDISP